MLILANIFGYLYARRRIVLSIAAFLVILVLSLVLFRSCGHKAPKLNEQEIQNAQKAIAVEDRKTMIEILSNSEVREKQIDGNISNAKADTVNAIADSKAEWSAKSNQELADELERRANQ